MNGEFFKQTLGKLRENISRIRTDYRLGTLRLTLDWMMCYVRYGATPTEWYHRRLWKLKHCERRRFITHRKAVRLDKAFNPADCSDIFLDKLAFNRRFAGFVERDYLFTGDAARSDIEAFVARHRSVVVKPLNLSSGRGIFLYDPAADAPEMLDGLLNGSEQFLLESRVVNHPDLARLNPPSCQTVRVTTLITRNGATEFLYALLRVGGGKSVCDNFHARGVIYPVDLLTGRVSGAGRDIDNLAHLTHPTSEIFMPGFQVPRWGEVLEFVTAAASIIPRARLVAWDVAVTPDGLEMIEGNCQPYLGSWEYFEQAGKYPFLKSQI